MFKHLIALVPVVLAALFVSPAFAQQPPGANVGTLTCKMAPSIGFILDPGSGWLAALFPVVPNPPEAYVGVMGTIGLDVGITAGGVMAWAYLLPPQFDTRRACRHLRGCEWRYWRWRRRWCQPPVRRNRTLDRSAAAFCRGVGRDQPVSRSLKSHAFLRPMRIRKSLP